MRYVLAAMAIALAGPAIAQSNETIAVNLPVVTSFDLETTGPVGVLPQPVEAVAPSDKVDQYSNYTFDLK